MRVRTALVLAGSRGPSDPLAEAAGVSHKALIEVGGVSMLTRVITALAAAGFERIAVSIERPELVETVRPREGWPAGVTVEALPAQSGPSASVEAALAALGAPLLVTTADHALLRPEWVERFLADAPPGADVAAALARAAAVQAAAPEGKRTFLRFSDDAYSGCNLFLLATPRAAAVVRLWSEVERLRKQPLRLLARLGPWTALSYAMGRLSLDQATARLGRLAGVSVAAVVLPFGQAAIDVDKPADLDLARLLAGESLPT